MIAITGTGFNSTSVVDFSNDVPATTSFVSTTKLTATVPAGAVSGVISVTTGAIIAYSFTSFTVTPNPAITVAGAGGYAPSSGPPTSTESVSEAASAAMNPSISIWAPPIWR